MVTRVLARGIAALAALAVLGATGPAMGGSPAPRSFAAPFGNGGSISFELVKKRGDRKVRAIEITDMAADCEGRAGQIDFKIYGGTPVLDDRSFAVRSNDASGGKAVVRATFARRFKRAEGTARLHGEFDVQDGWSACESGKQKFKAGVTG